MVNELHQQIRDREGNVLVDGKPGQVLLFDFIKKCKANKQRAEYGHHYRVMKRRKDPRNVVLICRATGEHVVSLDD